MTIEHEELAALLPQKGKMFLIGRIPEVKPEEWRIESETEITENYLFYEKSVEGVPNYVCLEMIAQTVAASMQEMGSGIAEINSSAQNVSEMSNTTKESIETLKGIVEKFKLS